MLTVTSAFAWTAIDKQDPNDIGLKYLDNFYKVTAGIWPRYSIGSASTPALTIGSPLGLGSSHQPRLR